MKEKKNKKKRYQWKIKKIFYDKKIYGPPGTGKTEKLIRRALAYIRTGTQFQKIGYFAFTKKAAREAKERMFFKNQLIQKKDLTHFVVGKE